MFFDTLWVNTKLKLSVPSAGLEMPSIFCSTQGPTATLVLELLDPAACHGQPTGMWGRCTLRQKKGGLPDGPAMTIAATARRNTNPASTRNRLHLSQRGI